MIDKNMKIKIDFDGSPKEWNCCHNGSSSVGFRRKSQRTFEYEYTFKNPEVGLKCEWLEDGWYWVCGCPVCAGIESNFDTRYFICDDHDNCVTCGINRGDIDHTPWGVAGGWRCRDCQDKIDYSKKVLALEKYESGSHGELDTCHEDDIICPHCGTVQCSDDVHENSYDEICETCGGSYDLEINYSVSYSTEIKGDRITLESVLKDKKE